MGRVCEMCPAQATKPATIFCPADACFLCAQCDDEVHSANRLAGRHVRRPLSSEEFGDGSSINDDSELGLVPDVTGQPLLTEEASAEASDPDTSADMLFVELPNPATVPFEGTPGYDFCDFEVGIDGRMPALCAIEDDAMFAEGKNMAKSLYGELSWETVVPENIEHVVPDVSESFGGARVGATGSIFKRDPMCMDIGMTPPNVVTTVSTSSGAALQKGLDKGRLKTVTSRNGISVKSEKELVVKRESTLSSSTDGSSLLGKKREREDDVESGQDESTDSGGREKLSDRETDEEKDAEQRKKRRMEALARFRSKRANRSFVKKVRYECRKQLADSRPRVKGRFVRKIEMALYRKYGALYREHLDELKQAKPETKGDHCVPTL